MDKILYLEGGKVSAFGTHAELCATCESYRNLVELQKLDDAGEDADIEEVSTNA
jgi:ABC-type multidrug transport system fused ATPase/permease subunit